MALIVNPVSGRGRGRAAAQRVNAFLEANGVMTRTEVTARQGDAREMATRLAPEVDVVVAVGGDGTLSEVLAGVRGHSVPVGLIPVGTANVVARELGLPLHPERAAAHLLTAEARRLDVGEVNHRPFLAMVGVGFDGQVVRELCRRRDGPITMASYFVPALKAIRSYAPRTLRVTVDGVRLSVPVFGLIVSNTRNYGGVFSITPDASPSDGWLDYQSRLRDGFIPVLRCGLAAVFGRRASPALASYGRGRHFLVEADEPVPVQVDGDYLGTTPVEITLSERGVDVLAPPSGGNGKSP